MDSIYVVAFYTDEILTTGGPESFTGLPGMILGIAIPHEHVSWFATKVEAFGIADTRWPRRRKVKKTTMPGCCKPFNIPLKTGGRNASNLCGH